MATILARWYSLNTDLTVDYQLPIPLASLY
jgi:hypothetical protein